MIQTHVTLIDKETIAPAWWRLQLTAPDLTARLQPGQFLLLRCGHDMTCYLRRPIFPAVIASENFTLLLRPDPDPGLAWLLAQPPNTRLDVIGPLGLGFPFPDNIRNLLLVGDTPLVGPLLGQMGRALQAGLAVTLALGSRRATDLYPVAALPPAVEFQAATLDGSLGHHGAVTDLLPDLLVWADAVCAVGSPQLYHALKTQTAQVRLRAESGYLYGLLTTYPLACGVGACLSCTVETESGLKQVCVDGPVFDLTTVNQL